MPLIFFGYMVHPSITLYNYATYVKDAMQYIINSLSMLDFQKCGIHVKKTILLIHGIQTWLLLTGFFSQPPTPAPSDQSFSHASHFSLDYGLVHQSPYPLCSPCLWLRRQCPLRFPCSLATMMASDRSTLGAKQISRIIQLKIHSIMIYFKIQNIYRGKRDGYKYGSN